MLHQVFRAIPVSVLDGQGMAQLIVKGGNSVNQAPLGNSLGVKAISNRCIAQSIIIDLYSYSLKGRIQRYRPAGVIGARWKKRFGVLDLIDDRYVY
jgi:hypothetical protein